MDWQKRSLHFLLSLYELKNEKDIAIIRSRTTCNLQKYAGATAAAFIRLEDVVTARILYSTSQTSSGFIDADYASLAINAGDIKCIDDAPQNLFPGKNILFPIIQGNFSGIFIIATHITVDDAFNTFLYQVWEGLKGMTLLAQTYYSFEHLSTRYNAIMSAVDEAILFLDDSGRDGWVNKAASLLLNIKEGRNPALVVSQAMHKWRLTAANANEIAREAAKLFQKPDGMIKGWHWLFTEPDLKVLDVSCEPVISENIKGRLWVFADITPIYLASEELKKLNAELEVKRQIADDQNKAKSDFLANMSHEIRTPMNGVIGMTSMLALTQLDAEQQDYVDTIRVSGESLLSIINDILDFSKIESGKMELETAPFRLSKAIEEAYDLMSVKANEKRLDLLYYIEPDVPADIIGDSARFRQVLLNLISNGIKFTNRGEIEITVENAGLQDGIYTLQFTVKDTGIGIPSNKFYKLFDSFSQVDSSTTRKYGGTGLGLAICQRLVKLMGGDIHVESEEGRGTSFIFSIKVMANTECTHFKTEEKPSSHLLNGKKVLILDDNDTNLKILSKQCSLWGMYPMAVDNYQEALKLVSGGGFDVAIIDLLMPDTDGIQVGRLFRQQDTFLPLILFSSAGYLPEETDVKSLFSAVINKPAKHDQIKNVLLNILGGIDIAPLKENKYTPMADLLPVSILVAEDDEINQKFIVRAMSKLGYVIDLAGNGKEAVQKTREKKYDIVFMDIMMPEMDGFEATRVITEDYKSGKRPVIIGLTANALAGDREKIIAAGMDDYLSKPYKIQDIKEALEKWAAELKESYDTHNSINLQYITELACGENEFIIEIIESYLETVGPNIEALNKASLAGDKNAIAFLSHKLKGTFRYIGSEEPAKLVEWIEQYNKENNLTGIPELISSVKSFYAKSEVELKQALASLQ
ncbi:response regulator [Niabella sp. CJ426]|uniref:response regulator n=1 Tax=Niabella sp. CJ426 TaxID=3393740 RepID=UPI003D060B9F